MAGELNKEAKIEIAQLARLIADQSEPITAWAKTCKSTMLRGIAHGICMAMGGVAKGLIELIEEGK